VITRLDHIVIAVRDLDEAMRRFQALGFAVSPGGRHTGRGTHNAIIRFGLEYLELLSIYDEAEIGARGLNGESLSEFLKQHESGLIGYALATDDIAQDAERFEQTGLDAEGPFAMQRLRPDGRQLSWRLLVPGGTSWRRPWPFLIHWDTPDAERLSWEQPGIHLNGANGVASLGLTVRDLEQGITLYQHQLGVDLAEQRDEPHLKARRASFRLGAFSIHLFAPSGTGPVQQALDSVGDGPFELALTSHDLQQTQAFFAQAGIQLEPAQASADALALPAQQALGARLLFRE